MKISVAAFVLLVVSSAVGAFNPSHSRQSFVAQTKRSMSAVAEPPVVTGPKGKPATSHEEDLLLTLRIIRDHDARSTTVSKDQFIQQMEEAATIEDAPVDVSVPYDAAAKLAYEASDKSIEYDAFKVQYEADAVEHVKSKQPIDVSIPYDAAAKLEYEASDKSMPFAAFKARYEEETVAFIKSKQPMDLSIPYDAAARLAYDASDKSMVFADFRTKYEGDAVADVIAKRQ